MAKLQATKHREPGGLQSADASHTCHVLTPHSDDYISALAPREVLDLLEAEGYVLAGQSGPGQTCIWTMHKPRAA